MLEQANVEFLFDAVARLLLLGTLRASVQMQF